MTKRKKIKILRNFILFGVLSLIVVLFSYLAIYDGENAFWINFVGQVFSSLGIVLLAGLLISMLYNRLSKVFISVVGFFFIYIFGMGLHTYDSLMLRQAEGAMQSENMTVIEKITDIIFRMNATLSEFSPSMDYASDLEVVHNLFIFHFFHLLIYFFIALIVFSFLGRRILNRAGLIFIKAKDSNVFWNYSENGLSLARDIIDTTVNDETIFILAKSSASTDNADDLAFDAVNKIGGSVIYEDYSSSSISNKIYKSKRHFFMTEDEDFNVKMAFKVLNALRAMNESERVSLYIYTQIDSVSSLFKGYNADIHLYRHCDLTARQFIIENPILAHKKIKENIEGDFDILILGFGATGFEIFSKSLCDAQFLDRNFSITCIDKDYKDSRGKHSALFKDAKSYGFNVEINPSFNGEDVSLVNSEHFYAWLDNNKHILDYDRIIVCLGDDDLNIKTALQLSRIRMNYLDKSTDLEKIFVHIQDFNKFRFYEDDDNLNKSEIIDLFGKFEKINTCSVIINEDLDELAKLVNFSYARDSASLLNKRYINKEGFAEINSQWEELDLFNKDSSRAISITFDNLILLAGGRDKVANYLDRTSKTGESNFEYIVKKEHRRWCAFLFLKGIRRWDMQQVHTMNGKLDVNGILTKHIALVEYEKLDAAALKLNEIRKSQRNNKSQDYKDAIGRMIEYFPVFIELLNNKRK